MCLKAGACRLYHHKARLRPEMAAAKISSYLRPSQGEARRAHPRQRRKCRASRVSAATKQYQRAAILYHVFRLLNGDLWGASGEDRRHYRQARRREAGGSPSHIGKYREEKEIEVMPKETNKE